MPTEKLDAIEIVERVRKLYRSFSTYSDEGLAVCSAFSGGKFESSHSVHFRTQFARPGKLALSWSSSTQEVAEILGVPLPSTGILVVKGGKIKQNLERLDKLSEQALSVNTFNLNPALHFYGFAHIPALFLFDQGDTFLKSKCRFYLLGDATADGVECYRLKCFTFGPTAAGDAEMFVSKSDFQIARLNSQIDISQFQNISEFARQARNVTHFDFLKTVEKVASTKTFMADCLYKSVSIDKPIDDAAFNLAY